MSIINDALKKARREAGSRGEAASSSEEDVIVPRRRVAKKTGWKSLLPAFLLVIVFIGMVAGLCYFVYQEYFVESVDGEAPSDEVVVAENGESPTPPPADERDSPTPVRTEESSVAAEAAQTSEERVEEVSGEAASSALSRIKVNGVMRGGNSVRVITNSGVYRVGDVLSDPAGFVLIEIGDNTLSVRAPSGEIYQVTLP